MVGKHFLGFGFGPIQSGLMLLEAQGSGHFDRYTIVEILPELVAAIRDNGNRCTVNVASDDGISVHDLHDITILNPHDPGDRAAIADAVHDADELATAIPSVDLYAAGGDTSIAALLAAHANPDKTQVLYASENNNYAAEILREAVDAAGGKHLERLEILNTVIGKMSGVIQDPAVIADLHLKPFVPESGRAVLVEAFNHIYVSAVRDRACSRGIDVFEEKDDLLPFEEAKLFGHNAVHALLGYHADLKGYTFMSEIRDDSALMDVGRRAFIEESGAALLRKHADFADPLFTPDGYTAYADDLLQRMTNPYLHDEVERICRDPVRKLGYGDRLVGTMREALLQDVTPKRMAGGAAAALRYLVAHRIGPAAEVASADVATELTESLIRSLLDAVWKDQETDACRDRVVELIVNASTELEA